MGKVSQVSDICRAVREGGVCGKRLGLVPSSWLCPGLLHLRCVLEMRQVQ